MQTKASSLQCQVAFFYLTSDLLGQPTKILLNEQTFSQQCWPEPGACCTVIMLYTPWQSQILTTAFIESWPWPMSDNRLPQLKEDQVLFGWWHPFLFSCCWRPGRGWLSALEADDDPRVVSQILRYWYWDFSINIKNHWLLIFISYWRTTLG